MRSKSSSQRLRILHLGKYYAPERGGMETHLQQLAEQTLPYADVEVVVASRSRKSETTVINGVPVHRVLTAAHIARTPICPSMTGVIRKSNADIVHLHLPNPWAALAYLVSGHKGKLIVSYHSDVVRQRLLGKVAEPVLLQVLDRADAIVVPTRRYQESSPILSHYVEKSDIIPYGIDCKEPSRAVHEESRRIRSLYGDRLIGAVGRLVYYKGFEYLIRSMRQVEAQLLLIGDGPLGPRLRAEAMRCGAGERVHFLNGIDDLAPYYQAVSMLVLPAVARSEAFGIVQLEAMAAGKPVINTSLDSGVPTVSLHNLTGLTVPPADETALAGAINLLLGDEPLRRKLGEAAGLRARQEFDLTQMTQRTMCLYQRIVCRNRQVLETVA